MHGMGNPTVPTSGNAKKSTSTAPRDVAAILERAAKWQVALEVERTAEERRRRRRAGGSEERDYFRRPDGPVSGVRLGNGPFVLTTHYNVGGRVEAIKVTLADGLSFPAAVIAHSVDDDLALLRYDTGEAEPPPLPPAVEWSDSGALRTGQFVFVTGRSPDPRSLTVTRGIISSLKRNGGRVFQTDAEVNYGNVGGLVLDLDGRAVGLAGFVGHTRPQWGVNSGIGFGIKASTIKKVLPTLLEGKDVVPAAVPFLGVGPGEVGFTNRGFRIGIVRPDSSAAKAGIEKDDVLIEFDGRPVDNFNQLRSLIFARMVNDTVKVKVRRGEKTLELDVLLGAQPEPPRDE